MVDLPQPPGPKRLTLSPSCTLKLTSSRRVTPPKDLLIDFNEINVDDPGIQSLRYYALLMNEPGYREKTITPTANPIIVTISAG